MPLDHDFDTPLVCPICRARHDASANMTGPEAPTDGDVSMCIMCGGISVYDSTKREGLRFATDEELEEFAKDERILAMQWARKRVRDRIGPPKGSGYDHG
jgi:hypothetical protein